MMQQMELPKLTVYLPPEMEQAVYADFLTLSQRAVNEATKNVIVNKRYLNKKQLAKYFSCGHELISEWQVMGLKSFMKGKEITFDMEDVASFLDSIKQ